MEELDVVASSSVGRARVWTEARKRLRGVKVASCILMLVLFFKLVVLVLVERFK
jgi:hypothetical protein